MPGCKLWMWQWHRSAGCPGDLQSAPGSTSGWTLWEIKQIALKEWEPYAGQWLQPRAQSPMGYAKIGHIILVAILGLLAYVVSDCCLLCFTCHFAYYVWHYVYVWQIDNKAILNWTELKLSWCPIFQSNFIYRGPIFKWAAETWLYDRVPG